MPGPAAVLESTPLDRRATVRSTTSLDAPACQRATEEEPMRVNFRHVPHPRIAARKTAGPPRTADQHVGVNGRVALLLTSAVGTMWCAYAFAILALLALPDALRSGSLMPIVQWLSQTFIQLVMLSVIMVGQNILGKASDKRAEMTYQDADATFHEAEQIQAHLAAQDEALNAMLEKMERLEAALGRP
jgi:hypothetical protein